MKFLLSICLTFAAFSIFSSSLAAQETYEIELSGSWRVAYRDNPAYSRADFSDDEDWKKVLLPENLAGKKQARSGRAFWLRNYLDIPNQPPANLALVLGKVFDEDRVYFNGVLIGQTKSDPSRPTGFGRPRVYPIPAHLISETEKNVIAIRIKGAFSNEIGILEPPLKITTVQAAHRMLLKADLSILIFAGIYASIGIFFILLYFRIKELKEYLWFGFFSILFGLMLFLRTDYRMLIADQFLFFKLLEGLSYIGLATLFFYFFKQVYEIKFQRIVFLYPILNGVTALSLLVFLNPLKWKTILLVWFIMNLGFFGFYSFYSLRKAFQKLQSGKLDLEGIILAFATSAMTIGATNFFAVQHGWMKGPPSTNMFSLAFMLAISMALLYRMIRLQLEVEGRQSRLNSVNELRDHIFSYVNSLVHKPAEEICNLGLELLEEEKLDHPHKDVALEMKDDLDQIQTTLDDILELSRLEVFTEPEYVETVNFNDFITAVIPSRDITSNIKVNPNIVLKTSLELVNSIVIRLIDFPGFKKFKHIDLIITSDLEQNIHFRFLLYHDNFRETRKLHELLTSPNPERGSLWIKWGIIREIIRILNGDLTIQILNRKFLRINIKLAGSLPEQFKKANPTDQIQIRRKDEHQASGGHSEAEALATVGAIPYNSELPPPPFHSNMSVTEFIEAVKARVIKK